MLASIIIRTLNEERHLEDLLKQIRNQVCEGLSYEIILVDSGSNDRTIPIAESYGCKIVNISREDFSFGRSLNLGCENSTGEYLVMISGHCVPVSCDWLRYLCDPLIRNQAAYSYGKQIGSENSRYSERRIFEKYYPQYSSIPQEGFFCNNANAAIKRSIWDRHRFDEELTGCEDMDIAKRIVQFGEKIGYVAESCVYHHHDESWRQIKRRFEREAIALQQIMPQVHISISDLVRYVFSSIFLDWKHAFKEKIFLSKLAEIVRYRVAQYWGSFVGNHDHRNLSFRQKEEYFYPYQLRRTNGKESGRTPSDEGQ